MSEVGDRHWLGLELLGLAALIFRSRVLYTSNKETSEPTPVFKRGTHAG
jgi:hypothetical protein